MSWGPQTDSRGTALTGRRTRLPKPADLAEMIRDGQTAEDIAGDYGLSPTTDDRHLKQGGFNPRTGYRRDAPPPEADDADDITVMASFPPIGAWADDALCAQTDPEEFYPEKGESTRQAKAVCASCEVRTECLQHALDTEQEFGIWGGLSAIERRALKKGTMLTLTCPDCGNTFHTPDRGQGQTRKYCSQRCSGRGRYHAGVVA